jgi:epoxyqueuosine reductase
LPSNAALVSWPEVALLAKAHGFSHCGVSDCDLEHAHPRVQAWLDAGFHGEMDYMVRHAQLRRHPAHLMPHAQCVLMLAMPYRPASPQWRERFWQGLEMPNRAMVSVYAQGKDYHKRVRKALSAFARDLAALMQRSGVPAAHSRAFCDSAPIMEVELARKAGVGWRGKHTLLLNRDQGSMFFLGSLTLSAEPAVFNFGEQSTTQRDHCGSCEKCIEICPTRAIVAPYKLDARRCISYLTIEHQSAIPLEFRRAIGNRIYGCDDCQMVCPWNRYAQAPDHGAFEARNDLDTASLVDLFDWSAEEFEQRLQGSPIRRIGHERWLRNIAVALGNALHAPLALSQRNAVIAALQRRRDHPSALVRDHVLWALEQPS